MTTPERLRRRQIRNDLYIVILAALLVLSAVYFQGQNAAQKRCLTNFIHTSSVTSKIRSQLYVREAQSTRRFLLNATDPSQVKTTAEFLKVREIYARDMKAIDADRAANPVLTLPKGVCD